MPGERSLFAPQSFRGAGITGESLRSEEQLIPKNLGINNVSLGITLLSILHKYILDTGA